MMLNSPAMSMVMRHPRSISKFRAKRHGLIFFLGLALVASVVLHDVRAAEQSAEAQTPTTTALETDPASDLVDDFHATLLAVMQDSSTLGFDGRYQTVGKKLQTTFDFQTIGRIVTGRYWRDFDDQQKQRFVATFAKLSAATYADQFKGYAGERFETDTVEDSRGGKIVKSRIIKADGDAVALDYVLREQQNGWKIINVIADGVSDLSLKRADYTSAIKQNGLESLIERLDAKIQQYAAENS